MKGRLAGLFLTALSISALCANALAAPPRFVPRHANVWVTYPDKSKLLAWDGPRRFEQQSVEDGNTITIDATRKYQEIDGFGAAMTDSSAWLIRNALSPAQRELLMRRLFGSGLGAAGISYVRIPLGASDFSLTDASFDDTPGDLEGFSTASQRQLLAPLVVRARQLNRSLKLMGTPFTAPYWMKTSQSHIGGKLDQGWYPMYADYLRRAYDEFKAAGMRFDTMTIQNEPRHDTSHHPSPYAGMVYEWYDELNFVRDHLKPRMQDTKVKLLTFDHNWDMAWYPEAVLREGSGIYAGSAWHCYGGDPSAMTPIHEAYPDMEIHVTECTGEFGRGDFGSNLHWNVKNMFIGGVRNWARSVMLWNLALDPQGNPHNGGCSQCRGVVTIDQKTGRVTYNEEFYAIAHFSKFVWPGAHRIESSNSPNGNFLSAAFLNEGGNRVVVLQNQSEATQTARVVENGRAIKVTLPGLAVATVFW